MSNNRSDSLCKTENVLFQIEADTMFNKNLQTFPTDSDCHPLALFLPNTRQVAGHILALHEEHDGVFEARGEDGHQGAKLMLCVL